MLTYTFPLFDLRNLKYLLWFSELSLFFKYNLSKPNIDFKFL